MGVGAEGMGQCWALESGLKSDVYFRFEPDEICSVRTECDIWVL